jgi:hypothetical protein
MSNDIASDWYDDLVICCQGHRNVSEEFVAWASSFGTDGLL